MKCADMSRLKAALLGRESAYPTSLAGRPCLPEQLAVHRQTVRRALIDALRGAYPTLDHAVGNEYFTALAGEFVVLWPPETPVMHEYGAGMAAFVEAFPPLAQWPWLSDLARLDWAAREAFHCADADPLPRSRLLAYRPKVLLSARLFLHPSLRLIDSDHPAWTLWRHASELGPGLPEDMVWRREPVQVWRLGEDLMRRRLSSGELLLLQRLQAGHRLERALFDVSHACPDFDASKALAQVIHDGIIVGLAPSNLEQESP